MMEAPAIIFQRNFDMYREKALEHGYSKEEIDSVEQRIKWLYRHSRHPLRLPRQIDLLWAQHQLLNIEREMNNTLTE